MGEWATQWSDEFFERIHVCIWHEHWSCFAEDMFWPTRDTNTISCKIYIQSSLSRHLFPFRNDKQNKICIKSIKCFFKRDKYNRNSKQISANKSRNTKNGDAKSLLHLSIDYLNSSQIQFFFRLALFLSRSRRNRALRIFIQLCVWFSCSFIFVTHCLRYVWQKPVEFI